MPTRISCIDSVDSLPITVLQAVDQLTNMSYASIKELTESIIQTIVFLGYGPETQEEIAREQRYIIKKFIDSRRKT